jgi:hypothetical protein
MQPDGDGRVVHGRASDRAACVHATRREGIFAVDDPQVVPVERSDHLELVVDEVLARVEPVAGLEDDHTEAALGKLLREHASRGAAADDAGVDTAVVTAHGCPQLVDATHRRSAPTNPS